MGLVINTNTPGIKNSNTLSRNARRTQRSMAKLASGAKINRAADDASGLAISKRMRNQIAVLDIDVDNCDDGANMLQVADGAMAEVSEMLIRCSVLAGRATNGILGDEEREIIQDEIDELHEEIDRIYLTTNFNGIQVFGEGSNSDFRGGLPSWMIMDQASQKSGVLGSTYTDSNGDLFPATYFNISSFDGDVSSAVGKGFSTTCCGCKNKYCIEFIDDTTSPPYEKIGGGQDYLIKVGIKGATTPQDVYDRILMATGNQLGGHSFSKIDFKDNNIIIYDNHKNPQHQPGDEGIYGMMKPGIYTGGQIKEPDYIQLKIGETSTSPDFLKVEKPDISTENLGIYDVFVLTQDEALEARDAYKAAGEFVSSERGRIGAYQNRLAHTVNTHTGTIENTTAAKSRIEDTDMAKEISEYTSNNILTQSAQAMLAQAQTNPQNVLSLLQPGDQ